MRTGEVKTDGITTDLKTVFEHNYVVAHPQATQSEIDAAMAEYVSTAGDKVTQILDDLNKQSESAQ